MTDLSNLKTKIVRNLKELSPAEWDRVFPPSLKDYYYYKSFDETDFEGASFYYILVYKDDVLIGLAPCFLMSFPLATMIGSLFRIRSRFLSHLLNRIVLRALFCGTFFNEGRLGLSSEYGSTALEAIVEAMGKLARNNRANIIAFKEFTQDYRRLLDPLLKKGFFRGSGFPTAALNINFKDFNGYLMRLSPSSRENLKRNLKKAEHNIKMELKVTDNADLYLDKIYDLYAQTFKQSKIKYAFIPKEYFINLSRNMQKNIKFFLWFAGQELVAFHLCFVSSDSMFAHFVGLDYSLAYKYHLYFVTFRDHINWCLAENIKIYDVGAMAYETKKRLGFSFFPNYVYMKHLNRLFNPLFGILFNIFMKPEYYDPIIKKLNKQASA